MDWLVLLLILVALVFMMLLLQLFARRVESKLAIMDPPMMVHQAQINKSKVSSTQESSVRDPESGSDLVFVTEGVRSLPIREMPMPQLEASLWSLGDPRKISPSQGTGSTTKWELHVHFTLHNCSDSDVLIYDMHTEVYYVTGLVTRLLSTTWTPRIELTQDNSILAQGMKFSLDSEEAQSIELVFETSLYDTLFTTIVFGIFVDYQLRYGHEVTKFRIPSEKIYVVQHDHRWKDTRCSFVARNEQELTEISKTFSGSDLKFVNSILQILKQHVSRAKQVLV